MNRVFFAGTIEKAPKLRKTEEGEAILNLFLRGETRRGSIHVPVQVRGPLAEKLASADVGARICAEGELDWESYEKNGARVYQTVIFADLAFIVEA